MKKLTEMTEHMILNLTEEEIQSLIDLECAEKGVPFLVNNPKDYKEEVPKPDKIIYEVADNYFEKREDAEKVVECVTSMDSRIRIDWEYGYEGSVYVIEGSPSVPKIESKEVYSSRKFREVKDELKAVKKKKKLYDEQVERYNDIKKQRREIESEILDKVHKVRQKDREKRDLVRKFKRYLTLANGDNELAYKFLKNAKYGELLQHEGLEEELLNMEVEVEDKETSA